MHDGSQVSLLQYSQQAALLSWSAASLDPAAISLRLEPPSSAGTGPHACSMCPGLLAAGLHKFCLLDAEVACSWPVLNAWALATIGCDLPGAARSHRQQSMASLQAPSVQDTLRDWQWLLFEILELAP